MKPSKMIALLALLGLLAGCTTVMDRRISEHADTWRQLSEPDRQRLIAGRLQDGDTEDMARIAFGPPDKILPATGRDGEAQTVWVYDIFVMENHGNGTEFDNGQVSYVRMPSDERRITFQNGSVLNGGRVVNRGHDAKGIRDKIAAFRAKYNLPASFHLTDKAQIEEFRAIFGHAPDRYN